MGTAKKMQPKDALEEVKSLTRAEREILKLAQAQGVEPVESLEDFAVPEKARKDFEKLHTLIRESRKDDKANERRKKK